MNFKIKTFFICVSLLGTVGCVNNIVPPQPSNAGPAPGATGVPASNPSPGGRTATENHSTPPTADNRDDEMQTSGTVDRQAVNIQVKELRRIAGNMVMLRLTITNNGTDDINGGFFYQDLIRTYLLDSDQQKKYEIIRDANSKPIATAMTFDTFAPKSSREVFAQFPAPPPSTVRMSIYFGGSNPILDVPLAR